MSTALILDETKPILTCPCHEPEGVVTRHVYPMPLTPQNLKTFWEKAKKYRTLYDAEVNGDFKKFCELFISQSEDHIWSNGLFWRLDDFVGVFYMTHIQAHDAQIHYSFFDRRHHGRQLLCKRMFKYVFDKYGFRRLSAEIPYFAKGAFPFAHEVGMKVEGRRRKAVLMDNEWFDVRCFGILREEAE